MKLRPLLFTSLIVLAVAADRSPGQQSRPVTDAGGRSKDADAIQASSHRPPDASTSPASNAPPSLTLQFVKDYVPGTVDVAGKPLAGTEMMNFAVHGGRLYAGLGNRNLPDDASVKVGAQVIVKDSANAAWRVEHQFARTAPRVNAMISAVFSTDASGRSLEPAIPVLVAAPSDASAYENTASDHEPLRWATVWTRDDDSGDWTETRVYSAERRKPACRSFGVYRDPITRVCHLFAGTSHGSIHRAVYEPTAPGRLVWNDSAELDNVGRVVAFAECNGILYAACGLRRTRKEITGGLYRRSNGPRAHWECVYRWPWPARRGGADEAFLMRGLTAVPAPDGDGEVLLGSRAMPGVIERIDPRADYAVTTELDLRKHFAKAWNLPNYRRAALSAYNTMTPWTDPGSGGQVHLIGVAVLHPRLADTPPHNGAWYLVRHSAGHYSTGYIYDSEHPVPSGTNLRGTRAIIASPFDNTTVFAGGGDIGKQISLDTAWIYRSTLPAYGK